MSSKKKVNWGSISCKSDCRNETESSPTMLAAAVLNVKLSGVDPQIQVKNLKKVA